MTDDKDENHLVNIDYSYDWYDNCSTILAFLTEITIINIQQLKLSLVNELA